MLPVSVVPQSENGEEFDGYLRADCVVAIRNGRLALTTPEQLNELGNGYLIDHHTMLYDVQN